MVSIKKIIGGILIAVGVFFFAIGILGAVLMANEYGMELVLFGSMTLGVLPLAGGILLYMAAGGKGKIAEGKSTGGYGAANRAFLQFIGLFSLFMGLLLFVGALIIGQPLWSLVFLAIAIGGAYAAYYPYKHMGNFVARPAAFRDVFYDEKGLYYDIRGKPYLFKWDEIKEYRILSVTEIDMNPNTLSTQIMPIGRLPISIARYIAWRKIDPEYASTGIMKLGTVQFIKKDGSSIVLTHVFNPYRLIPIFDKYIKENSQKKDYHM